MSNHDAWQSVARECPCRIIQQLHQSGEYHHGFSARFPGKILCFHRGDPLPAGWTPTPAQEAALRAGGQAVAPQAAPQVQLPEIAAAGAAV